MFYTFEQKFGALVIASIFIFYPSGKRGGKAVQK
jgi:hypothetical protein